MSSNKNYNRNRHQGSDNNDQSNSKVHGGEQQNGRLSQIKNDNQQNPDDIPNQYRSELEEDIK